MPHRKTCIHEIELTQVKAAGPHKADTLPLKTAGQFAGPTIGEVP